MRSTVAVRPVERPVIVFGIELHPGDSLSGPLGPEVFPLRRSTFNNRHRLAPNVDFHSDLVLKIRWNHSGCVLVNLPKVEVRNAGHSETLRSASVGVLDNLQRNKSRRLILNCRLLLSGG